MPGSAALPPPPLPLAAGLLLPPALLPLRRSLSLALPLAEGVAWLPVQLAEGEAAAGLAEGSADALAEGRGDTDG